MTTQKLPIPQCPPRNIQLTWLLAVLLIGTLLRLWQLDQLPPGFHFDEAFEGLEAWRILTDPAYRPIFLTGNFGVPPLNSYANALIFGLWQALELPIGPTAMRTTATIFGLLGIFAVWGLAQELRYLAGDMKQWSWRFPLWAAALLATMRWHIHFSRMGIEPIIVPLIWAATTACILHGWRTGHLSAFAAAGVLLAGGMYAYQGAWVIPFLIVATILILLITGQSSLHEGDKPTTTLRRAIYGTVLAAIVAAALVAPLGLFFVQNLELVFLRPAQLSIVGETASPADGNVIASVWATARMFGPVGNVGDSDPRRNLPGLPALSIWYAIAFYLGLGLTLIRIRQPGSLILLVGLLGLLAPGVVSEYAPHFHRVLGAAAPTALLCAVGLEWLWQRQPARLWKTGVALGQWLVVVLLVAGSVREAQNYFIRWAALPDLFHAFDVGLWQVGQQIAAQPADTPLYLTPRTNEHATLAFAWSTAPNAHSAPVTFDGRQIFPVTAGLNRSDELYFVIEHEDFRTRLLWPGLFTEAPVVAEIVDGQGAIYARTYRRPAQTALIRQPQVILREDHSPLQLGDGIALIGYDVQPPQLKASEILYLQLYWHVESSPSANWTVFTHLLQQDADGAFTLVASQDSQPGGASLPTTHWQPGWLILDEYQIVLPSDTEIGSYMLATGLYQPSGEQLPAVDSNDGRILLGAVEIE